MAHVSLSSTTKLCLISRSCSGTRPSDKHEPSLSAGICFMNIYHVKQEQTLFVHLNGSNSQSAQQYI